MNNSEIATKFIKSLPPVLDEESKVKYIFLLEALLDDSFKKGKADGVVEAEFSKYDEF